VSEAAGAPALNQTSVDAVGDAGGGAATGDAAPSPASVPAPARTVHYQPPVNVSYPARADLFVATVVKDNGDGTIDLIAHDGNDTPHFSVPFLKSRDGASPEGDWAVAAT
jgi:hypothetical protein